MEKKYDFDQIIPRENTNCVKYDLRSPVFGKSDVIPLWVADMDFKTPDFIVEAIQKRSSHEIYGYSIKPKDYTKAIIDWQARRHQWNIHPDWIASAGGVVPSLGLLTLALTQPGDKIIIQPPVYFPFAQTIRDNGRQVVENPLLISNNRYEMDFDDLEQKIDSRTKMLFFCSPHNPGGRVWTKTELEKLGEIAIKHDLIIVSDEIHGDLVFEPHRHIPLAGLSTEISQQTITTVAPSKTFNAAGLLSSVVITENQKYKQAYLNIQAALHLYVDNIFGTAGLIAAYTEGDNWLNQLLAYIKDNLDYVTAYIDEHLPTLSYMIPEGTYLLWLDFSKTRLLGDNLHSFLVQKANLGLNRGDQFGSNAAGFARMNLAAPRQTIVKAMQQLQTALESI